MTHWHPRFSPYAQRVTPSAIFALTTLPRAADTINLGPGEPDAELFPADELAHVIAEILSTQGTAKRALQYTVNAGEPELREKICADMRRRGVECMPRNVLVTNGAQQALDLLTALLLRPASAIVVQTPTYPGALDIFRAHGARVLSLGDEGAPAIDIAFLYATAHFHNPTGTSLSPVGRAALIARAHAAGAVLVEDDPYEAINLDGVATEPLLAQELRDRPIDDAHSVYVGTFSKSIAPGLRIGWVVGAAELIERLTLLKQAEDMQAGTLAQVAIARIHDRIRTAHVPRLCVAYRARRDAMLTALAAEFGNRAQWSRPSGGFFVWLTLPFEVDTSALLAQAALSGVTYVPGRAFSHDGSFASSLRLSYSCVSPPLIAEGISRLARTVREVSAA